MHEFTLDLQIVSSVALFYTRFDRKAVSMFLRYFYQPLKLYKVIYISRWIHLETQWSFADINVQNEWTKCECSWEKTLKKTIGRVTKLNNTYLRLCFVFLSQVNGQNVVKVGHRQVVNMIRQGGNSLMVKVVMVTRNPDMDEGTRKKSKSPSLAPWVSGNCRVQTVTMTKKRQKIYIILLISNVHISWISEYI